MLRCWRGVGSSAGHQPLLGSSVIPVANASHVALANGVARPIASRSFAPGIPRNSQVRETPWPGGASLKTPPVDCHGLVVMSAALPRGQWHRRREAIIEEQTPPTCSRTLTFSLRQLLHLSMCIGGCIALKKLQKSAGIQPLSNTASFDVFLRRCQNLFCRLPSGSRS
jgi:hypothetical protein